MNEQWSNILHNVAFSDILAKESKPKESSTSAEETTFEPKATINEDDFVDYVPVAEIDKDSIPYNAKEHSESLVNMINGGNVVVMTPIAHWKLIKLYGGRANVNKMRVAFQKKNEGKELSEQEEKLATAYTEFSAKTNLVKEAVPYTHSEMEMLKKASMPMLERSKTKVSADWAFWVTLLGVQTDKIFKVLSI